MEIDSNVDKAGGPETNPHGFVDPRYMTEGLGVGIG